MKQEGPKKIVIPRQEFNSCYGCIFFERKLIVSGHSPKYRHNCSHPEIPLIKNSFLGNLQADRDDHVKTPSCCPFIKTDPPHQSNTVGRGTLSNFEKSQFNEHGTIN